MAARVAVSHSRFDLGQNAEINVTPFVDVMLVLLIIFMVAAPLATRSHKIDAPPTDGVDVAQTKPIYVSVGVGGAIHIVDIESSLSTLAVDLADAIHMSNPRVTKPTDERVMIRADRTVAYRDFMGVLNVLRAAGYDKVGLISEAI